MIKVRNLVFKYRKSKVNVINDLSFDIKDNTINIILGLNGCGKTTLIKLLVGLEKANSGSIVINDRLINDLTVLEKSKEMSYVSQNSTNNSEVNVFDYLTFGMTNQLKFYERPTSLMIEKVNNIAHKFDIEKLLDKNLGEISGGERQLVAICASLLQDSKIIILDEPTSALDVKNQTKVLQILKDIALNNNKTIIFTSHNPNHALALDANVLVMNDGKIVMNGLAKEIVNKGLKDIYGDNLILSKELNYEELSFKL